MPSQLTEQTRMFTRELPLHLQVLTTTLPCWRKPFRESPEKITPSMPRSPSLALPVTDRLTEDTTRPRGRVPGVPHL